MLFLSTNRQTVLLCTTGGLFKIVVPSLLSLCFTPSVKGLKLQMFVISHSNNPLHKCNVEISSINLQRLLPPTPPTPIQFFFCLGLLLTEHLTHPCSLSHYTSIIIIFLVKKGGNLMTVRSFPTSEQPPWCLLRDSLGIY